MATHVQDDKIFEQMSALLHAMRFRGGGRDGRERGQDEDYTAFGRCCCPHPSLGWCVSVVRSLSLLSLPSLVRAVFSGFVLGVTKNAVAMSAIRRLAKVVSPRLLVAVK